MASFLSSGRLVSASAMFIHLSEPALAQDATASPFALHLGGQPNVSNYVEIVTNRGAAPLTGLVLRESNFPGHPGTRFHPVVRCKMHLPAVPVGGSWGIELPVRLEISSDQVGVQGAIFADGSNWGDARAISKLREMAAKC